MDPQGRRQVVLHLDAPCHAVAAVAVFLEKPCRLLETHPALSRALIRFLPRRQEPVHLLDRLVLQKISARPETEGQGFRLPTNLELAAVSRKLGELFRQGLIRLAERRVWIGSPAALRALAEE